MAFLITIDGDSGVGKGTLSKGLAKYYNSIYLDSGAIYRAAAIYLDQKKINLDNLVGGYLTRSLKLLKNLPITFRNDNNSNLKVYLQQKDITEKLRLETTGLLATKIAKIPEIREVLLKRQRDALKNGYFEAIIAEGRDMGTVVFPKATIKLFLTASAEVRATRRYNELINRGDKVEYQEILDSINKRDKENRERTISPALPAKDAYIFDTSNLDAEEVLERIQNLIESYIYIHKVPRTPYDSQNPNQPRFY